jgi:hypothetical protein
MTRRLAAFPAVAFLLVACAHGDASSAGAQSNTALRRALALANLAGQPRVVSSARVTPARPIDGNTSLIAVSPVGGPVPEGQISPLVWDPADGATGSITTPATRGGNPREATYVGVNFNARVGLRYLVRCVFDAAGGYVNYEFGPDPTGSGRLALNAVDFAVMSDAAVTGGRATFAFANEQNGHKVVECRIYGVQD